MQTIFFLGPATKIRDNDDNNVSNDLFDLFPSTALKLKNCDGHKGCNEILDFDLVRYSDPLLE